MAIENTHYAREGKLAGPLASARHLRFIGVCGAGMRTLAALAAREGYLVSGSDDDTRGEGALALGLLGIPVSLPSRDSGIIDADMAVYSIAVRKDHPELAVARERGIPTVSRADLLGALMEGYGERIGVAGTHGKSTVTAMTASLLASLGRDPTVVAGAAINPRGDGFRAGGRGLFVFEACEYFDSFLSTSPTVAVLTNAEWDHPDYFRDEAASLASFRAYLTLPSVRLAVLSGDDAGARRLAEGLSRPYVTFGLSAGADVAARALALGDGSSRFRLAVAGEEVGEVTLRVPGRHNVQNALAAAAAAMAVGVAPEDIPSALGGFSGIPRRTEYRGSLHGVSYYEDYAHHPTAIRAALLALRGEEGRLLLVYQPHTFSRTEGFFSEMASALSAADLPILADTYAARETTEGDDPIRALAKAVGGVAIGTPECAALYVRAHARPGDRVVVMGAGDLGSRFFTGDLAFTGD